MQKVSNNKCTNFDWIAFAADPLKQSSITLGKKSYWYKHKTKKKDENCFFESVPFHICYMWTDKIEEKILSWI